MPQINQSALVQFSAAQIYRLVNDVDYYADFLPGCTRSRVIHASNNQIIAVVDITKSGISKSLVTRNTLIDAQSISMHLVDGPFRKLKGSWQFIPLTEKSCKVKLYLDFEFSNTLIELIFGKIFQELAEIMIRSFTLRARQVYSV